MRSTPGQRAPLAPTGAKAAGTLSMRPPAPTDDLLMVAKRKLGVTAGRLAELLKDVGCKSVGDFKGMLGDVPLGEFCDALLEADPALGLGTITETLKKMAAMVGHDTCAL